MIIEQTRKTHDEVRFTCEGTTLIVQRQADPRYPEEADDAWCTWQEDIYNNPRTFVGGPLFILFQDFLDFNDKALKFLQRQYDILNHYTAKQS